MKTTLKGVSLLRDPRLNKSTAFSEAEREALGLDGLVREGLDSEETQIKRGRPRCEMLWEFQSESSPFIPPAPSAASVDATRPDGLRHQQRVAPARSAGCNNASAIAQNKTGFLREAALQ